MKNFLVPMLMLVSISAMAGDKGNGGNTVDVNGIPRLRDLVDNTICSWVDGEAMMKKNPTISDVMKRLAFVDWYFAEELKREIKDLNYCLTGKLVKIDTNDYDSLVTTYVVGQKQVAIRLNRAVYINEDLMNSMPTYDQAFLLIHEAMHSYISDTAEMRNQKVRSSVKAIESVYKGNIVSTESYHLQMKNNRVMFPLTVKALSAKKAEVLFIMSDYAEKRETVLQAKSVNDLFESIAEIPAYLLASWHRENLNSSVLENFILQALQQEDLLVLKRLIDSDSPVREITLGTIYANQEALKNPAIRDLLANGNLIQIMIVNTLRKIGAHQVGINEEGRITVPGMELLAQNAASEEVPFTALISHTRDSIGSLKLELRSFVQIITIAIQDGDTKTIDELVVNNPDFYSAFGIKEIKNALANVQTSSAISELEKQTAIRKVDVLLDGIWELMKAEIEPRLKKGQWKEFVKKIDQERLGYKIK